MSYQKPGRKIHQSMRGEPIDMDAMRAANESTVAVTGRGSDLRMNARGDVLVKGGVIGKSREDIELEYHRNPQNAARTVSLKDIQPDTFETPQQVIERLEKAAQAPQPMGVATVDAPANVVSKSRARKLIDKAD